MINEANVGHCYYLNYKFQQRHRDYTLVHGYITNRKPPYQTIDHAWCMKDDMVYDAVMGKEYPWAVYEYFFGAEIDKKYTYQEVMTVARNKNSYGPWHEVRELNLDKYYDSNGEIKREYSMHVAK